MNQTRASLWCAHPRMRAGESLSSWLHRSAFANGMADHTFCRHLFGSRPIWNRDIDRLADAELLRCAAVATYEDVSKLRAGIFSSFEGLMFPVLTTHGHLPWVLAAGIYHRTRRRHGQQFCILCLRESTHLRLHWRLAWAVCCTRHRCYLWDACPTCDAPLAFHRMSLAMPGHLFCPICGTSLAKGCAATPSPQRVVRFQHKLEVAVARGNICVGNNRVPAGDFFTGARVIVRAVFPRRRLVSLNDTLPRWIRRRAPPRPQDQWLEHWRLAHRIYAMDLLRRSLADWPRTFISSCLRAGIYRTRFEPSGRENHPQWLEAALSAIERGCPISM